MKIILIEKQKKDKLLSLFQLIKLSSQAIHFYFEDTRLFIQGMNSSLLFKKMMMVCCLRLIIVDKKF
jgi:hypothetical protein